MSETEKVVEVNAAPVEVKTEPKVEPKLEVLPPVVAENNDDIFITGNDTFTSTVRYYKKNGDVIVEKIDDEFDAKAENIKSLSFTCKYPSQGDFQAILNSPQYKGVKEMRAVDLMALELTRPSVLIRKWSVNKELSALIEVDPKIIKGMLFEVSERIGLKGII